MKSLLLYTTLAFLLWGCHKEFDYKSKEYPYLVMEENINTNEEQTTFSAKVINYKEGWIESAGFSWQGANGIVYKELLNISPEGKMTANITSDLVKGESYICQAFVSTPDIKSYSNNIEFINKTKPQVTIDSIYPNIGYDNDTVLITGKGFSRNPASVKIKVANTNATIISAKQDSIRFVIPPNPHSENVDIELNIYQQNIILAQAFYIKTPQVEKLTNISRHSNESIILKGTNLYSNGNISTVQCIDMVNNKTYNCDILSISDTEVEFKVPMPKDLLESYEMNVLYSNGSKSFKVDGSFTILPYWREFALNKFYTMTLSHGFSYGTNGYTYVSNKMYKYESTSDTWSIISSSQAPNYPDSRAEFIREDDKLYVFGGLKHNEYTKSIMAYDIATNTWQKKEDIPFTFKNIAHETIGRYTYIITSFDEVWKCDFSENEYIRLNMFQEVTGLGYKMAFIANDELHTTINNKTYKYIEAEDRWDYICESNFEMDNYYYSSTVHFTLNNTGYFLNKGQDLYRFNAKEKQWDFVIRYPYSNYPTNDKAVFTIGNKAYIIITDSTYEPVFYIYEE